MNRSYLLMKAAHCRGLARTASDAELALALNDLADEFEVAAVEQIANGTTLTARAKRRRPHKSRS